MEEAETEAIIKWLQTVDKPLETKEKDRKRAEPEGNQKRKLSTYSGGAG